MDQTTKADKTTAEEIESNLICQMLTVDEIVLPLALKQDHGCHKETGQDKKIDSK